MSPQKTLPGISRADHSRLGGEWENDLAATSEWYRRARLADVRKQPHNWSLISEKEYRKLQVLLPAAHLARTDDDKFMQRVKSDVDFTGGGRLADRRSFAVCFDAKETRGTRFPLQNVERHQVDKLKDRARAGWVSGLLVRFSEANRAFFVSADLLDSRYYAMLAQKRGRGAKRGTASLSLEEIAGLCPEIFRDPANALWHWLPVVSLFIPFSGHGVAKAKEQKLGFSAQTHEKYQ